MPTRPAVAGLVKHQLMHRTSMPLEFVTTLWTFKNTYPVASARITYEQGAILAWLTSHWKGVTSNEVVAEEIRTWDFGVSPPARYATQVVTPNIVGTMGARNAPRQIQAVIALRTQAVGSLVRNRLNGRVFHAGIVQCSGDAVESPTPANLVTCYTNLLGRLNTAAHADSGDWVVPAFFLNGAPRVPPLMVPINHVLVRTRPAVQRRRAIKSSAYARGT